MAGYHALLSYRYSNLCIKADPASLLSVTLIMGSMEKDIEEVAEVAKPEDEYHLAVVPKIQDFIMDINQAVLDTHPEFKVEMKPLGDGNDRNRFLLYEMPEVNKERRDFLNETVDSLYNECKVRIEAVTNEQKMTFAEFLTGKPEELKEANDALNKSNDDYNKKLVDNLLKVLNPREQKLIKMRFGLIEINGIKREFELIEVAEELNLTTERVRQLETEIIKKLRKEYGDRINDLL